jgi:hypothetical protein
MPSSKSPSGRRLSFWAALFARSLLQAIVLASCIVFLGYWFAVSLNAWWESNAAKEAARHFTFPFLNAHTAHRRDKADRYFLFSMAKDLTLAVRPCSMCVERAPLVALHMSLLHKVATLVMQRHELSRRYCTCRYGPFGVRRWSQPWVCCSCGPCHKGTQQQAGGTSLGQSPSCLWYAPSSLVA